MGKVYKVTIMMSCINFNIYIFYLIFVHRDEFLSKLWQSGGFDFAGKVTLHDEGSQIMWSALRKT